MWERIEPLLPKVERCKRHAGRKRWDYRMVLCGILFVLHTGIRWEFLPQELGFGSGMKCWRRLAEWHQAGVWERLHRLLLEELHAAGQLDWSRAVVDSSHVTQLMPLLAAVPPVRGRVGRPRRRPGRLLADRGYDHDKYRRLVWAKGIKPVIARRGAPHGSGLGVHRYVVERTIGLLHWFRRLRIRWEIRDDIHEAFMTLAAAIICWRRLVR
ncbi:transposase [Actinomadura opuntiae]|uniref:transposase n=1 Tax=Actinomadura sp. OS1-43 TaxID=604315 RepID=UPI00406285DF